MTAYKQHLEIVFVNRIAPGDIQIITEASAGKPGLARLLNARIGTQLSQQPPVFQLLSHNGGAFVGYVGEGEPLAPYQDSYWLVENGKEQPQ